MKGVGRRRERWGGVCSAGRVGIAGRLEELGGGRLVRVENWGLSRSGGGEGWGLRRKG